MNHAPVSFGQQFGRPSLDRGLANGSAGGSSSANVTSMRWSALGDAGKVVALLAGMVPEAPTREQRNFPALIRDCPRWRRELANMVADLAAVMEPGIAALLAVNARGADPRAAAQALWREYVTARTAIMGLLPPMGQMGPPRAA